MLIIFYLRGIRRQGCMSADHRGLATGPCLGDHKANAPGRAGVRGGGNFCGRVHPGAVLLRIDQMRRLLVLVGWLVALPCLAGPETPYVPARDDIVLQTVASISDPRVRAFGALRAALNQDPRDVTRAVKLSEAYLDYGRDTGDARYLGRAEAVIAPWLARSPAPIPALLVHATILQSRHYFPEARAQLRAILERDDDNAQAWLTLASVAQVQGDMRAARQACAHLLNSSDPLLPGACLSSLNAVTGNADNAYRVLTALWPQARAEPAAVQSWIQGIWADTAKYLGDDAGADLHFRLALQLTPEDNFLLADYGDFLLDQKRPQQALDLLKNESQSDTSFLRQVYAEAALGLPQAVTDTQQMATRFAALETRGTRTYLREQAGFELYLQHHPQRALELAQENWTVQHAPEDMRVFLEAALAAGKPEAARPVLDELAMTRLQYPIILSLAAQLRAKMPDHPPSIGRQDG
jgi:Tfp pilus assembly protein PilF